MEINKKIRSKKKNKIISFDDEIVTKDNANEFIINKQKITNLTTENAVVNNSSQTQTVTKENHNHNTKNNENIQKKKQKKKQSIQMALEEAESSESRKQILETQIIEETTQEPKPPKKESKRAQKRKKYEEQVSSKKLRSELGLQEKALNYLSKWKHCKSEWKFEKLRQVWLQQNMFDTSKIPDEFWEITVEYFSGSQGRSKQQLLDEALKIVEQEQTESADEIKLRRARDIIQNLQ